MAKEIRGRLFFFFDKKKSLPLRLHLKKNGDLGFYPKNPPWFQSFVLKKAEPLSFYTTQFQQRHGRRWFHAVAMFDKGIAFVKLVVKIGHGCPIFTNASCAFVTTA